jgi:hypothetical protein
LEALIKLIIRKRNVKEKRTKQFLAQLLTPHLSTLNLSSFLDEEIDVHYILRLATIRCQVGYDKCFVSVKNLFQLILDFAAPKNVAAGIL